MVLAIVLAAVVIAGSMGMRAGRADPVDAIECETGVINEKEDVDTPKIAITFDDGPHPYYTEQLLDGLKERGAKASFFVMGKQAEAYPKLVLRMHEEGHLVGNHTYSHIQLGNNNREVFKAELVKTNEVLSGITGEEPQYVRPPSQQRISICKNRKFFCGIPPPPNRAWRKATLRPNAK